MRRTADKVRQGKVYLVGAGPGDPELLTQRAVRLLRTAEVVLYDRLIPKCALALAPPSATRLFVGKREGRHSMSQRRIAELMILHARAGRRVVRLQGGDPLIFGRLGEEVEALRAAGVPFEIVPGVTAASACAAYAGVPLTHRDLSRLVILSTGHGKEGEPELDWSTLARPGRTLVFYMGHRRLEALVRKLIDHGLDPATPAALVANVGLGPASLVCAPLARLPHRVRGRCVEGPALVLVGEVVGLARGEGEAEQLWEQPAG